MRHILLTVSYDGTNYFGFQIQNDRVTVQEVLQEAIFQAFGTATKVVLSSRTDRGVHARGQKVTCMLSNSIPTERIPKALQAHLPADIVIVQAEEVPVSFHPRYDATEKIYEYSILNSETRNPLIRNYTYFVYRPLAVDTMIDASKCLLGTHDFKAFCSAKADVLSTVRTLYAIDFSQLGDVITIRFRGNGFLYNMIRIIVGTLIDVGQGRFTPHDVARMLASCDRTQAGKTAGPEGLVLLDILYGQKEGRDKGEST